MSQFYNFTKYLERFLTKKSLTFRRRLYANILALLLATEAVGVALATAVPEAGAAAVLHIIVPLHRVIAARATLRRQAAGLCTRL